MNPPNRRRLRIGTVAMTTATLLATLAVGVASADPLGVQQQVSLQGTPGDASFTAGDTDVAYDDLRNRYLVVWSGSTDTPGEIEVYGRFIDAAGGSASGPFVISTMDDPGDAAFDALNPRVVYNRAADEFFVVWRGDQLQQITLPPPAGTITFPSRRFPVVESTGR